MALMDGSSIVRNFMGLGNLYTRRRTPSLSVSDSAFGSNVLSESSVGVG